MIAVRLTLPRYCALFLPEIGRCPMTRSPSFAERLRLSSVQGAYCHYCWMAALVLIFSGEWAQKEMRGLPISADLLRLRQSVLRDAVFNSIVSEKPKAMWESPSGMLRYACWQSALTAMNWLTFGLVGTRSIQSKIQRLSTLMQKLVRDQARANDLKAQTQAAAPDAPSPEK